MNIYKADNRYGLEGVRTPRSVLRGLALSALGFGVSPDDKWLARPRVQFLHLHHLFPEEEAGFRQLLRCLSQTHQLLGYSEAVARLWGGQLDQPYLCFSFDDGLRQNLRAGAILREFGVTGCFFICPGLVGETDPRKLTEICNHRFSLPPLELLSWDDVETLRAAGHEIGGHTMTHPILAQLSAAAMADEIGRSAEVLRQRLGAVQHFAWPVGEFRHFTAAAARFVFAAGFQSCASGVRGCHVTAPAPPSANLCLRRDYISAHWPLSHALYFLHRSSRAATAANNQWPAEWRMNFAPH